MQSFCYGTLTKNPSFFVKLFSKATQEDNQNNLNHFMNKKQSTGLDIYNPQIEALEQILGLKVA